MIDTISALVLAVAAGFALGVWFAATLGGA
jgi:hypothetical protein